MNGGGVYGGSLSNCALVANNAAAGGGAYTSRLYQCTLEGNDAPGGGGGAFGCVLQNCLMVGNTADNGGAAILSTLYNCTLVNNTGDAGSSDYCTLWNCITTGNPNGDEESVIGYSLGPHYAGNGIGNIQGDPLFVDEEHGDYRLRPGSPCINAGTNGAWTVGTVELDGQLRIYPAGGRADMGAYESVSDASAWHKGDSVVTAGQAFALGNVGLLMIRGGTQLVFAAGAVTNVLDVDICHP